MSLPPSLVSELLRHQSRPTRSLAKAKTSMALLPLYLISPAIILSFLCSATTVISSDAADLLALLSIKAHLQPSISLSSWGNMSSMHFCRWEGVTCNSIQNPGRVTALDLSNLGLTGTISPDIGNLTFLLTLNLSCNNLQSQLPPELGRLSHLESLLLWQNSLQGRIPADLANCSNLLRLSIGSNKLTGEIPAEIGALRKLSILSLHDNSLSSSIPSSLGNLSSLAHLDLVGNRLSGTIPSSLGRLHGLVHISVTRNRLAGDIPSSIFNISSLSHLYLGYNFLSGVLPPDMGNTLVNLEVLQAFGNLLEGPIPISIPNASKLIEIVMPHNRLSGKLPGDIGKLMFLSSLSLRDNRLEAKKDEDWKFVDSLANSSNLQIFDLSYNNLEGLLPTSIANLSTQLTWLGVGGNKVYGSIPQELGRRYINLNRLYLDQMKLIGIIPATIGKLQNLHILSLNGNQLSGDVPSTIGNLTQLEKLFLNNNNLQGNIPKSLSKLQHLTVFDLSFNMLDGSIPNELTELTSLTQYLNLSHNFLTGPFPSKFGSLRNLEALDISENKLSGEIPNTLGECQVLQYLYLQGNKFRGTIPDSLSSLSGILELDLSSNYLSGPIPPSFKRLEHINFLNLSFNNLEGQVPYEGFFINSSLISVTGNIKLCGGNPDLDLQPCPRRVSGKKYNLSELRLLIPIGLAVALLMLSIGVVFHLVCTQKVKYMPVVSSRRQYPIASYRDILRATDGFLSSNIIGKGSFGQVYRGIMEYDGTDVAIKVFDTQQLGAFQIFKAECETLGKIKHRNLTKILTACSSLDHNGDSFLAIVTEYMPNGSLDEWLHPQAQTNYDTASRNLSFLQILNIAIDVASALDYLHNYSGAPIVHCDLKPSNVLLDNDMVAHLCDFGSAKFLKETATGDFPKEASNISGLKGSIGYIAPEYGMGGKPSTKGDVYSYGVLLLEMISGRRPTDVMFKDGECLHSYMEMAYSAQIIDVVDPLLLLLDEDVKAMKTEKMHQCLFSVIRVGLSCSNKSDNDRLEMQEVIKVLHDVQRILVEIITETSIRGNKTKKLS
ncbi:receptor-like protein kinase [Canna indica]|uniref:non-specific serine/threonine protein kinase n=1 Tax=Canna indica TaxID=4628 RepID=A0AAQ3L5H7_9LILI|nr:receptor-like protein kinase [Canna indica]